MRIKGERGENGESLGQLVGAGLSNCRELRAKGGSTRSLAAISQKTPRRVKRELYRREPMRAKAPGFEIETWPNWGRSARFLITGRPRRERRRGGASPRVRSGALGSERDADGLVATIRTVSGERGRSLWLTPRRPRLTCPAIDDCPSDRLSPRPRDFQGAPVRKCTAGQLL